MSTTTKSPPEMARMMRPHRIEHPELQDRGVSEIIGVVMLLGMVMTIMGGVFLYLQPYVRDFEDQSGWAAAQNTADRLTDRISVVGASGVGEGVRFELPLVSTSIVGSDRIEIWTIQADLTDRDRVDVTVDGEMLLVRTDNGTATHVRVISENGTVVHDLLPESGEQRLTSNHTFSGPLIIDVQDALGGTLHRYVQIPIGGVLIQTQFQSGMHQVALVNDARIERLPTSTWTVHQGPSVGIETLYDGTLRLTLVLSDIEVDGNLGSGPSTTIDVESNGPLSLFDGDARRVRFTMSSTLHSIITPQYMEGWLLESRLAASTGTLDAHRGLGPWERASGVDGITVMPIDVPIDLSVDLRRIVLS